MTINSLIDFTPQQKKLSKIAITRFAFSKSWGAFLFSGMILNFGLPIKMTWAANWPSTPMPYASGSPTLGTRVTELRNAITAYVTTPSISTYNAMITAQQNFRNTLIASAITRVTSTDTITASSLYTLTPNTGSSIQADGAGVTLTVQNATQGAALIQGAFDASATNGAYNVFLNNVFSTPLPLARAGAITSDSGATISLTRIRFQNNNNQGLTSANGGAILNGGFIAIDDAIFDGNTSITNVAGAGGAFYNSASGTTAAITRTEFVNNQSNSQGGAIYQAGGVLTIESSTFTSNSTLNGNTPNGGAISSEGNSSLKLIDSTFTENTTTSNDGSGGALALSAFASGIVTDSSFIKNKAGGNGGAIYVGNSATLSLVVNTGKTSLFSGNIHSATNVASSIYFANTNNVNFSSQVETGGLLDMRDPITALSGSSDYIVNKTGAGQWRLGGNNAFDVPSMNFNVDAGQLYLYAQDEVDNANPLDAAGKVNAGLINGNNTIFLLGSNAGLIASGENQLNVAGVSLSNDSLVRGGTAADRTIPPPGGVTSSLSFSPTTLINVLGAVNIAALSSLDQFTLNGTLTGAGSLVKTGAGEVILTGVNTYAGGTAVNAGILSVSQEANLGSSVGRLTLENATLRVTNGFTMNRPVTLAAGSGTFNLQMSDVIVEGLIDGAGFLTKTGTGKLTLNNSLNSYSSGTVLTQGVLSVANDNVLGNVNGDLTLNGGTFQNTQTMTLTHDVNVAATSIFENVGALTVSATISGSANLLKDFAANALILTGDNSNYSGNWTLNQGNLQVGNGAGTGTLGTGNVLNNTSLIFNRSNNLNYGGVISGTGTLVKQGTGVLNLSGVSGLTGDTSVQAGELNVTGGLAASNVSVASGAILSGGLNAVIGNNVSIANGAILKGQSGDVLGMSALLLNNSSVLQVNLSAPNSTPLFNITTDLTLDGDLIVNPLSGFGSGLYRLMNYQGILTDNGLSSSDPNYYIQTSINGQVNLVNTNGLLFNYWDGNGPADNGVVDGGSGIWNATNTHWTDSAGAINVAYQPDSFAVFQNIGGAVTVDDSEGAISACGLQFFVTGYEITGAPLTLTGAAEVNVGDGTAAGANYSATISSVLQGTSGLKKTGLGNLILNGINTYTGLTQVSAGTLTVDGVLAGTLNVLTNGRLAGKGTVSNATVDGVIAPAGVLNVNGSYIQNPGSQYNFIIYSNGTTNKVAVNGAATLNGGTVNVEDQGGYVPGTRYPILSATLGVNGFFSALNTSSLPFLNFILAYEANTVYLDIERSSVRFSDFASTVNQQAVANAADSLGAGNEVYDALVNLGTPAEVQEALNSLSGEAQVSALSVLLQDSYYLRDGALNRLQHALAGSKTAFNLFRHAQDIDSPSGWSWWSQGFGAWGDFEGNFNAARVDRNTSGILLGADRWLTEGMRMGMISSYSQSHFDVPARSAHGKSDNYSLGVYGGYKLQQWQLRLGGAYTWHDLDVKRQVAFPGFLNYLSSDYNAHTAQGFAEAAYTLHRQRVDLEPFVGLAYVNVDTNRWEEKGGAAALRGAGSQDMLYSTLGARQAAEIYRAERFIVGERLLLGWQHAYNRISPQSTLNFATGSLPFLISGVPVAKDSLLVNAGLTWSNLAKTVNMRLGYIGQVASNVQDHGVTGVLSWKMD